jgi:hypothetical protein
VIETSVDAQSPPGQDRVIASWGSKLRLVDRGAGIAAVLMRRDGFWCELARVPYGSYAATATVQWNDTGLGALEQYRRDALDTKIYSEIVQWLRGPR